MIIPKDAGERLSFVRDMIEKCTASAQTRRADYVMERSYFLFGASPESPPAHYNKIFPHIDQLASFLYSAESTQFTVTLSASVSELENRKVPSMTRVVNDEWLNSNADQVFSTALIWGLVYPSTFVKLIVGADGSLHPHMVEPASMGVLREDIPYLDRQEAICHSYYITRSELYGRLYSHPKRDEILQNVVSTQQEMINNSNAGVERLIITAVTPSYFGQAPLDFGGFNTYVPMISEDTVEMRELWVWDDETNDYQVFTVAAPTVIVFDRPGETMFLKGEHPFVQLCPNPLPDYFWGASEVQRLMFLQDMRTKRVTEILQILAKQAKPPTSFSGFSGITDEKAYAFGVAGAYVDSDNPSAKVDVQYPKMPEDLWREIHEIDDMFGEASGITPILSGRGESGVRSSGHASQLGRLGSSRPKKRALVIEDALEKLATMYGKCLQRYSKIELASEDGKKFIPEQFTNNYIVKVDAHSNSPIFTEDTRELAFEMLKAGVIDGESLLDLVDPPKKDLLKQKFKEMQAKKQQAAAQQQQAEAQGGKKGE